MRKNRIVRVLTVIFALFALAGYVACSQRLHNPAPLSAAAPAIARSPAATQAPFGGRAPTPPSLPSNAVVMSAPETDQIIASSSKSGVLAPEVEKLIQKALPVTDAPPTKL